MNEQEFRTGYREDGSRIRPATEALDICQLIDVLRSGEGDSVTILCDNPDYNGQPERAIICNGAWTHWDDMHFADDALLGCLKAAVNKRSEFASQ